MSTPNPYESPQSAELGYAKLDDPTTVSGKARQIVVVAILMMVQGGMELLYGGMFVVLGAFMSNMDNFLPPDQPEMRGPLPSWFLLAVYGGMGLFAIALAVVKIWAGYSNLNYRGRTLGIVALCLNVLSCFTFYCAPTGIALLIYGLIVYLSPEAQQAFAWGDHGVSAEEIRGRIR